MPEYTDSGNVNTSKLQRKHCPMMFANDGQLNLIEKKIWCPNTKLAEK